MKAACLDGPLTPLQFMIIILTSFALLEKIVGVLFMFVLFLTGV